MKLTYLSSGRRERVLEALIAADHSIEEVVATDPALWPNVAPTLAVARAANIPVHIVRRIDIPSLAERLKGRTCLSVGFAFILPSSVIAAASLMLNVHGSLLPKYAGARTGNWVIANGEAATGVTVHMIDDGVDTGPILLQRSFPLATLENSVSLAAKLAAFEPAVVVDALALLESGNARFVPQSTAGARRWPDRTPAHSEIDANQPLANLVHQILACDPDWYPAHFYYKGKKVCVRLWSDPDDPN